MTWTVTALGTGGTSTTMTTPVSSLAFTPGTSIAVGDGIAVFVQYTNTVQDTITVTDNGSPANVYLSADSIVGVATGQCLASFYLASAAQTATTITVNDSTGAFLQSFGVIKFTNTVAGTPTLDGHSGIETASGTSATSSTANSTNGDLVLNAIVASGAASIGGSVALAVTGSSPVIRNNQDTIAGYVDGSGVTTTGGANSVTSTYSSLAAGTAHVCLQMIFAPPSAAAACGRLALMGVGCSIGWRAALMGGLAAWRAGKAIERNESMTRRGLIMRRRRSLIGHNGGPALDE